MTDSFKQLANLGCSFLVAGRVDDNGTFFEAVELEVPDPFKDLFKFIPPGHFRLDISSTELRRVTASGYSPLNENSDRNG